MNFQEPGSYRDANPAKKSPERKSLPVSSLQPRNLRPERQPTILRSETVNQESLRSAKNLAQKEKSFETIYGIIDAIQSSMKKAKPTELKKLKIELQIWQQRAEELKKITEPAKVLAEMTEWLKEIGAPVEENIPTEISTESLEPENWEKAPTTIKPQKILYNYGSSHQPYSGEPEKPENIFEDLEPDKETEIMPEREFFSKNPPPEIKMTAIKKPFFSSKPDIAFLENATTDKELNPEDFSGKDPSTPQKGETLEEIKLRSEQSKTEKPKKSWFRRLFSSSVQEKKPEIQRPIKTETILETTPPPARPKSTGFLNNLLNTSLGRLGKRLSILGLASSWLSSVAPENSQSTEPIKKGPDLEKILKLDAHQDIEKNTQTPNELIKKILTEKAKKDFEQIRDIGTVGADNQHNAIVVILENQLEKKANLESFGFKGDRNNSQMVAKWANGLAKSLAQNFLDKGLNSNSIGRLVIDARLDSDHQPKISFLDTDGHQLQDAEVSKFLYQTGGDKTKDIAKKSSPTKDVDVWAEAEQDAQQELVDQNQRLEAQLLPLLKNDVDSSLNQPREAYEQAYKVWQESPTDVPEAKTFIELDQAAKNLEVAIERENLENLHQEFAAKFKSLNNAREGSLRSSYIKTYDRWQKALKEPASHLETRDPVSFLEERVKSYSKTLKSLLEVELQDEEISLNINELTSPTKKNKPPKTLNKEFQTAYTDYLTAYQTIMIDGANEKRLEKLKNEGLNVKLQLLLEAK